MSDDKQLSVYIASPWVRKDEARSAKDKFEAAGYKVTSHWIDHHSDAELGDPAAEQELQEQAMEDVEDIVKSDVFIILNLEKSEGKATELGFAYTLGKLIILVGKRERNIFYYLPEIYQCDSVEEAIEGLKPEPNNDDKTASIDNVEGPSGPTGD